MFVFRYLAMRHKSQLHSCWLDNYGKEHMQALAYGGALDKLFYLYNIWAKTLSLSQYLLCTCFIYLVQICLSLNTAIRFFLFSCKLVLTCCLFITGLKLLLEVTGVMPGTREECLSALKNGHLVSISPGGVREALFSDESYQLMWGNRKGFAQVALDAKVVSIMLPIPVYAYCMQVSL